MPRNMSFALTTDQMLNQSKDVTRRAGWKFAKPGDVINACVKCMGLKPGEKIQRLCQIELVSVRREPLDRMISDVNYGIAECTREGFPHLSSAEFVDLFCSHMKFDRADDVTRIEFKYVERI